MIPLAIVAAVVLAVAIIRGGTREGYLEPANEQAARHWEDMVDGHSFWTNGPETREQAIERLARPHLNTGGKK